MDWFDYLLGNKSRGGGTDQWLNYLLGGRQQGSLNNLFGGIPSSQSGYSVNSFLNSFSDAARAEKSRKLKEAEKEATNKRIAAAEKKAREAEERARRAEEGRNQPPPIATPPAGDVAPPVDELPVEEPADEEPTEEEEPDEVPTGMKLNRTGRQGATPYAYPVPASYGQRVAPHWGTDSGGTDIFAPSGSPVMAMSSGTVLDAGYSTVGGNFVTIQGSDGMQYYYAHLYDTPMVRRGQKVSAGQQLGGVGDTGNAKGTGPHLHLGVGKQILSGTGPRGGVGTDFDLIYALSRIGR